MGILTTSRQQQAPEGYKVTEVGVKADPRSHAPAWECIRKVLYAAKVSHWYNSSARNDLEQVAFLEVYREW